MSSSASFYGYDGHGSVRLLTNNAGLVTDTYTYDAFGQLIQSTGSTPNDYRYSGEQLDSNLGLYYLRARYLNAANGRFWSADAFEGTQSEPFSLHKYLYTSADPANKSDPSGNLELAETGIASAISAAFDRALIAAAVTSAYLAHYATRDYTVYSSFGTEHSFMFIGDTTTGDGWRYDLGARDIKTYVESQHSPWEYFEGRIEKTATNFQDVTGVRVPIAKFNAGHIVLWESLIQGIALEMNLESPQFPWETQYSFYLRNCHTWTLRSSATAIWVSLLPIPKPNGSYF